MQNQAAINLPIEIWELIFDKLGPHRHDHFDTISLVCKHFLSISSCFIHTLKISDPRILIHGNFLKLSRRFTQIKRIHVSSPFEGFEELDALMAEIARSGLNIEELRLSDLYTIPVKCYQEICSSMKELKTLTCKNSNLWDNSLIVIANSLPNLQELNTCGRAALSDTGIEEMASKLKELRKISLTISGRDAVAGRSVTANGMSDALRHCSNLDSLSVTYKEVDFLKSPAATIEKSVSYTRALRALEFRDSVISDAFLASIVEANLPLEKLQFHLCKNITVSGLSMLLRKYQSLVEFKFAWSRYLTDKDMDHLSKYLGHVTRINLTGCEDMTDSTFFLLTTGCPLLVDIKMCCTGLGKEGDLRVDLKKHSQVQSLDLSGCKYLNDESLKKIGYTCPNLQKLALSNLPDITEEGISEILKSCPGIRHFKCTENELETILGTSSEHSKLNIEVLEAGLTWINDEGMAMIGRRCPLLLRLMLPLCFKVTADGVKEVMGKCPKLMEIDLRESYSIDVDVLAEILLTRPSLRKVFSPDESFPTEERRNLFMKHGCRLY